MPCPDLRLEAVVALLEDELGVRAPPAGASLCQRFCSTKCTMHFVMKVFLRAGRGRGIRHFCNAHSMDEETEEPSRACHRGDEKPKAVASEGRKAYLRMRMLSNSKYSTPGWPGFTEVRKRLEL